MNNIHHILTRYPKSRPPLNTKLQQIYTQHYLTNRQGASPATSVAQKLESWMHHQVAQSAAANTHTLEIGAGTLNQLPYETQVKTYDIIEPFQDLYRHSPLQNRIRHQYADISEVPSRQKYHRITSIATHEHIENLPAVIASTCLHLKPHGQHLVAIPNTGSLTWYLAWRFTTGVEFYLKHRLDYAQLMRHEHLNTSHEIRTLLQYFFKSVTAKHFGPSRHLSLYHVYTCSQPRLDLAHRFFHTKTPA